MNTMHCGVSGIQNKESKTQIKNALNKIDGVREVGVNMMESTIKVDYKEPATENELKTSIESTGMKVIYE